MNKLKGLKKVLWEYGYGYMIEDKKFFDELEKYYYDKFKDEQVNNLPIQDVSDWLDEDSNDCGCPPEVCKRIQGKCKNLAYR